MLLIVFPLTETAASSRYQLDGGGNGRFALVYVSGEDAVGPIQTITYSDEPMGESIIRSGPGPTAQYLY